MMLPDALGVQSSALGRAAAKEMPSSVAALILAAGASTRLGTPKQLVRLGGETLLERSISIAKQAGCSTVVVVLGASAVMIRAKCDLKDVVVLENENWAQGMGSSIAVGAAALSTVQGCVVMTCDMPSVTPAHLRQLIGEGAETVASAYAGRSGVPAYFPSFMFSALKYLRGDAGAKSLLQTARREPLANGELDIDTPEDVQRMRELFE